MTLANRHQLVIAPGQLAPQPLVLGLQCIGFIQRDHHRLQRAGIDNMAAIKSHWVPVDNFESATCHGCPMRRLRSRPCR
jgi:hypothetical protein